MWKSCSEKYRKQNLKKRNMAMCIGIVCLCRCTCLRPFWRNNDLTAAVRRSVQAGRLLASSLQRSPSHILRQLHLCDDDDEASLCACGGVAVSTLMIDVICILIVNWDIYLHSNIMITYATIKILMFSSITCNQLKTSIVVSVSSPKVSLRCIENIILYIPVSDISDQFIYFSKKKMM